jgi:hypothetical protein
MTVSTLICFQEHLLTKFVISFVEPNRKNWLTSENQTENSYFIYFCIIIIIIIIIIIMQEYSAEYFLRSVFM